MSAENIKTKMAKKKSEIKKAQDELKKLRVSLKNNIGNIAEKSGLIDLDISDKDLAKEFKIIFDKYNK